MSNIIPPLLSDSPPPIVDPDDDEDEFGDFNAAADVTIGYENLSLTPTPQRQLSTDELDEENFDINSNKSAKNIEYKNRINGLFSLHIDKDFQDKRKSHDIDKTKTDVNLPKIPQEEIVTSIKRNDTEEIVLNISDNTVPIDTAVSNQHLSELSDIVPELKDVAELKAETVTKCSANVPCPKEILSDDYREDCSSNTHTEYNFLENIDNVVPSKIYEAETVNGKEFTKDLSFDVEPPDLHVIDDTTVDVEEFHYYNEYYDDSEIIDDKVCTEKNFEAVFPNDESQKDIGFRESDLQDVHNSVTINTFSNLQSCSWGGDSECDKNKCENCSNKTDKISIGEKCNEECQVDKGAKDFEEMHDNSITTINDTDNFANFHIDEVDHISTIENVSEFSILKDENIEIPHTIKNDDLRDSQDNSSVDNFFDFANFDNVEDIPDVEETKSETIIPKSCPKPVSNDEDDEFGDFGDYTQLPSDTIPIKTSLSSPVNVEKVIDDIDDILLRMFPRCEPCCDDFTTVDFLKTDLVFKYVKDVTDTDALTYQWSKSASQEQLLKALNIDTRNILHGPGWNNSMPKYASNLGLTPLEPVKSNESTFSQESPGTNIPDSNSVSADVPNAQFDWGGAGLINPLDCNSKDDVQKVLETENTNQLDVSRDVLTPVLRARFHNDNESVNSLQLTTDNIHEEENNKQESNIETFEEDFSDFTSYQSHKPSHPQSHVVLPLRETHIVNDEVRHLHEFVQCKENESDKTHFNPVSCLTPVLEPLKPTVVSTSKTEQGQINWPNPGITEEDILNIELTYSRKQIPNMDSSENSREVPSTKTVNISEKPMISVYNKGSKSNVSHNPSHSVHERKNSNKNVNDFKHSKPLSSHSNFPGAAGTSTKSRGNDDDEWSDFVSNPQPIKAKPVAPQLELRLSVPHLNQLQQPKKPIPVITPRGLIQTRIPSNVTNVTSMGVQQPSSLLQTQMNNVIQPSIISHQYQTHMNGSTNLNMNGFYNGLMPQPAPSYRQSFPRTNQSNSANDDDDWTDFISGPPVQLSKKQGNSAVIPKMGSNITVPNIIQNPVHLNYNMYTNRNSTGAQTKSVRAPNFVSLGSIPGISTLPNLDFIAPKTKGHPKK